MPAWDEKLPYDLSSSVKTLTWSLPLHALDGLAVSKVFQRLLKDHLSDRSNMLFVIQLPVGPASRSSILLVNR